MKRDFSRLDGYLDELQKDIYPQPLDNLHAQWMLDFIKGRRVRGRFNRRPTFRNYFYRWWN